MHIGTLKNINYKKISYLPTHSVLLCADSSYPVGQKHCSVLLTTAQPNEHSLPHGSSAVKLISPTKYTKVVTFELPCI